MNNHKIPRGSMKNQPGTMNNRKNPPEPWKTNLEPWKTNQDPWKTNLELKKRPWTMNNHKTHLDHEKPTWDLDVVSPSEHRPQTPAYASTQNSKKFLQAYIFLGWILHIIDIRIWRYRNMYSKNSPERFVHEGFGSARRRSWGSLTMHLQEVWDQAARVNKV